VTVTTPSLPPRRDITPGARQIAQSAARISKPAVERFGWDKDDCEQEAVLGILLMEARGVNCDVGNPNYFVVCLKRDIVRAATPAHDVPTVKAQIENRVAALGDDAARVELLDLIQSAPFLVRLYLRSVVLDGLSWEETKERHGWHNQRLARIRRHAELWLLDQYDGRKGDPERALALARDGQEGHVPAARGR
jgi:hypothetical protein